MSIEQDSGLVSYLARKLGATDLHLRSVWQNTEGWSMETFCFTVDHEAGGRRVTRDLILRREPVSGLLEPYDVRTEYRVLSALQDTAIALPKTFWFEGDPAVFERPFYAMEKVEGGVHFLGQQADPGYRLIPDDAEREGLATDFLANLAAIHSCDWRSRDLAFLGDPGPGKGSALAQVDHWARVIDRAGQGHKPLVTLAVNWLRNHAPDNDRVCLLHGDYRTGNYIHADGRIRAILDWEMVHLGDPHEDLVYVVGMLWRSPPPAEWVSHLLPEAEFLGRWSEATGIAVDPEKMAYYHVLNDLKAIGIITTAANAFAQGKTRDLRPGIFGTLLDLSWALLTQHLAERTAR